MNRTPMGPGLVVAIGDSPGKGGASAGGGMSSQDCVPLSTLNMPDETEQMQSPEIGDKVQYTVEGTVDRIEGDSAYIKRDAINGQAVGAEGDKSERQNPAEDNNDEANEPDADDNGGPGLDELRKMAGSTQMP